MMYNIIKIDDIFLFAFKISNKYHKATCTIKGRHVTEGIVKS